MYLSVKYNNAMDIELKEAYIRYLIDLISTNIVILDKYFECCEFSPDSVLNTSQDTINLSSDDKDYLFQGVKEYLITHYNIELVSNNPITLKSKALVTID